MLDGQKVMYKDVDSHTINGEFHCRVKSQDQCIINLPNSCLFHVCVNIYMLFTNGFLYSAHDRHLHEVTLKVPQNLVFPTRYVGILLV